MSPARKTAVSEPIFFTAFRILAGALIAYAGLSIGICPDGFLAYLGGHHWPSWLFGPMGELFPWLVLGLGLWILTRFDRNAAAPVFCGLVLSCAGLDKVGNPAHFSEAIANYNLLPSTLVPLAAVVIPWLEIFTGLALILGYLPRGAALLFCVLMAVYTFSLAWDLNLQVDLNCGCFAMDCKEKMSWWTVIRDILFLGAGFTVLSSRKSPSILTLLFPPKSRS